MYSVPANSSSRPPTSLFEPLTAAIDHVERDVVGGEPVGVDGDLVLLDEAADGGHLGDAGHRLQGVAQRPVLVGAELVERVAAATVDERVLEDPADPGGVRPELGLHPLRQARLDLGQVLEHPGARPVDVGAVLEDDVDVREAEVGEAADRLDPRRAEQRRDDRVGDLVLDDVGRAVPARVDDHLGVGEVGQGVQADLLQGVDGQHAERGHAQQHEHPVVRGELDDPLDHWPPPCW